MTILIHINSYLNTYKAYLLGGMVCIFLLNKNACMYDSIWFSKKKKLFHQLVRHH